MNRLNRVVGTFGAIVLAGCSAQDVGNIPSAGDLASYGGAMASGGNGAGAGGYAAPGAGGASAGQPPAPAMPCDIARIVTDHCALCHAAPARYGAPMSLMTAADFQVPGTLTPGATVATKAVELLHSTDTRLRMPPAGTVAALEPDELAQLTSWLNAGAQPDPQGCHVADPEAPSNDGGSGGAGNGGATSGGGAGNVGGVGNTGNTGNVAGAGNAGGVVGAGGSVVDPPPPPPESGMFLDPYAGWDAGVECFPFVAHDGSKAGKYRVGVANDAYVGFSFMPPWSGTRYVRAFRRVTDNAQVLHHWLFFQQAGAVTDGAVTPQLGAHPDGQLLHGWAPGGSDSYFTPDLGMEMRGDIGYLLELHYNSSDAGAQDASGVEICVSAEKPANTLALSWLGTDAISGTTATGTCSPRGNERIHIISGTPHMHLKGAHMKVVINRANGQQEIAHDEPFAFENQRIYPKDIWLEPGDTITTTCTFSSPSTFGPGTNQEMCYWFAGHYPARSLADGALIGTLIHGANSCLGL